MKALAQFYRLILVLIFLLFLPKLVLSNLTYPTGLTVTTLNQTQVNSDLTTNGTSSFGGDLVISSGASLNLSNVQLLFTEFFFLSLLRLYDEP